MHQSVKNIIDLNKKVKQKINELNIFNYTPNIIAVSKTFPISDIMPLIKFGHNHFGENKVQEAIEKWTDIKSTNDSIKLHMVGKLQSNKVKQAVRIFDYIHSVDSNKLAKKISEEQIKQNKKLKIFLQVNIGEEIQKSGITLNEVSKLSDECKKMDLDVIGLMCLPPLNKQSTEYFSKIKEKNDELNFNQLSLGMSNDFINALEFNSTFLRIGTKIFGERT
mgnify:CR=1 FL=1|tara:strand:+ start:879 stop:1541 length:663 start_codon:yes stop_codon:yes gene_type:complete